MHLLFIFLSRSSAWEVRRLGNLQQEAHHHEKAPHSATTHHHKAEPKFHPSDGMYHAKPQKHHKGRKLVALIMGLIVLLVPLCGVIQLVCRWRKRNYVHNWNDEDEEGFGEDRIYDQQELVALKKKRRRERREKIMNLFRKKKNKNNQGDEPVKKKKKKRAGRAQRFFKKKAEETEKKKKESGTQLLEGSIYDQGFALSKEHAMLV